MGSCNSWRIQNGLTHPVLSDITGSVGVTYIPNQGGYLWFPHTAIVDENQIVQYTQTNFNEAGVRSALDGLMNPEIAVGTSHLAFGTITQGYTNSLTLIVDNVGTGIVDVTNVTSSNPAFQVLPTSGQAYAYNDSLELTVTFAPGMIGAYSDSLQIISNAGNAVVHVSGTGNSLVIDDLTVLRIFNHIALHWGAIPAAQGYNVYADTDPRVEPIPANLIGYRINNNYLDINALATGNLATKFYRITAVFNQ